MNNKKLVIGIITLFFIGVSGFIYSLGAIKNSGEDVTITDDAKERVSNINATNESEISKDGDVTKEIDVIEDTQSNGETDITKNSIVTEKTEDTIIYVHVCGEVKKPDVYTFKAGTRVIEAVKKAGGFTKKAAKNYINQARVVLDGEKIYIPSLDEVQDMDLLDEKQIQDTKNDIGNTSQGNSLSGNSSLVNINTASLDQLMTLTGIGEAKAKSIIAYREENGTFKSIEELKNIAGIKDGVYQKIRDLITIN